ncbi:MAG: electron transfer flavoprotein subunit beta/FixA family protein [Bacteroidales bacterium]|nr:electron transfer flavoprotein subunit beta/FixA family protein [Bacteroidales bacterium]
MSFRILVLVKQVPDTRNVGEDAMKADGTVNRGALPAIFNPEDMNALEMALKVKDYHPDTEVIVMTMGPTRAADIIRESMYRGADDGYLLTDRKFAGSDTLATSYTLAAGARKLQPFDVLIAGRQAIDGDTAQVGPQVAEKLKLPQITYAENIEKISKTKITVKRRLDRGVEEVAVKMPVVLTAHSSADPCRPRNAKRLLKFKNARTIGELQNETEDYTNMGNAKSVHKISEWTVDDLDINPENLGLQGSPTKVKKIENVVFKQKDSVKLSESDEDIEKLMKDLITSHVIG